MTNLRAIGQKYFMPRGSSTQLLYVLGYRWKRKPESNSTGWHEFCSTEKEKKGTDETRHEEYNDTVGTTVQRVMG